MKGYAHSRSLLLTAGWVLFVLSLIGTTVAGAKERIELTVSHAWNDLMLARQAEFDEAFIARHPDIKVLTENVAWGQYVEKYLTRAAAGTLPDVMYLGGSWFATWMKQRLLLDLEPYMAKTPTFNRREFVAQQLPVYSDNRSRLHGIPMDINSIILFYNQDLFDGAGLGYPDLTWTYEHDFLQAAKKLTHRGPDGKGTQWGFRGVGSGDWWLQNYLGPWGGAVINEDETESLLDRPESVVALEWWANLHTREKVVIGPGEGGGFERGAWLGGRQGMMIGGVWNFRDNYQYGQFRYDIAHSPQGPVRRVTTLSTGSGYAIAKDTKHPEIAWLYLNEYLSKEGQEFMFAQTGYAVPSRRSAWSMFMRSPEVPKSINVEFGAMEYGELLRPRGPATTEITQALRNGLPPLLNGEKSPLQAAQDMKREIEAAIQRARVR